MGQADCRPNVLITYFPEACATVKQIVSKQPDSLGKLSLPERKVLLHSAMPVLYRYDTARPRLGRGQNPSSVSDHAADGGTLPCGVTNISADTYVQSSLIATLTKVSAAGVVVIVDVPLAEGASLDALADYVALVTLVPTRIPPRTPEVPSILDLFRADTATAPPEILSRRDSTFLSGL
jgi:hypothetical protein